MSLEDAMRQKTGQLVLPLVGRGEAPRCQWSGEASTAASGNERPGTDRLMEEVVERSNAKAALKRVKQNKGSPGVDGMTVDELPKHLVENWKTVRAQLLEGTYQPKPVREVEIPKGGGGVRKLGIPSVLDRFIQQSILQVLQPRFDPTFKQWRRGTTVFRQLCARGVPARTAGGAALLARHWWRTAGHIGLQTALSTSYFDRMGVPRLAT